MPSIVTFVDRVKFYTLSNGVGPFQIGGAFPAYQGAEALIDGATYPYATEFGATWEVGTFLYDAASGTAIRSPDESSNGGLPVSFPASILVSVTPRAADLVALGGALPIIDALGNQTDKAISQNAATVAIVALQTAVASLTGLNVSIPVAATEDIPAGSFVNIYGSGSVRLAVANDPTKFANGFALTHIANGNTGFVNGLGLNTGVVPGGSVSDVWLSDATPGGYVTSPPSGAGFIQQLLGLSIPGVGVMFTPGPRFVNATA